MVWFRAIWLFFLATAFALAAVWLAETGGEVIVRLGGWEAQASIAVVIAFLAAFLGIYIIVGFVLKMIRASLGK